LGPGFFPLRLVSFLSSIGSFIAIFLIVKTETKNWWVAFVSTGVFAATYRITGAWLDIARVDSLLLALWLFFVYVSISNNSPLMSVMVGILAGMSFLTKQTGVLLCLPVIAFLYTRNWKHALIVSLTFMTIIGISTILLDHFNEGWYSYYVMELMQTQTIWILGVFLTFWKNDLLVHIPLAVIFALIYFGNIKESNRNKFWFWLFVLVGAFTGTFATRVKAGAYDNVLLPLFAVLSILFGLGLNELIAKGTKKNIEPASGFTVIILIACIFQFIILTYNPLLQVPSEKDIKAGNELINIISEVEGNVFVPDHGYLPLLAGKTTYAHHAAIWDVIRGDNQNSGKSLLSNSLDKAIQMQYFDMIILDSDRIYCCTRIHENYVLKGKVFQDADVFFPVTGSHIRPTYIYTAKRLVQESGSSTKHLP